MSSKVKIVKQKTNVDLKQLQTEYNRLTGVESGDPVIIEKHYAVMCENLSNYANILDKFSGEESIMIKNIPEFKLHADEIQKHVTEIKDVLKECYVPTVPSLTVNKAELDDKVAKYKILKNHKIVKEVIILHNNLNNYSTYLEDKDNLSDNFIRKITGFDLLLFNFSSLNFVTLWNEIDKNKNDVQKSIKYYLLVLHMLHKFSKIVYNTYIKPDIDPKQFGDLIIQAIMELKKRIPRCNEAFDAIQSSIGLFEKNFDSYYKNFVTCNNPTVIMESFIMDVTDNVKGDKKLAVQMKKIVNFITSEISKNPGSAKDKNINNMTGQINKIFESVGMTSDTDNEKYETDATDML